MIDNADLSDTLDRSDVPVRVANELRWLTFLEATRDRLMALYTERCAAGMAEWAARPASRPEAVESLRVELAQLVDEALTWRTGDFVRRLVAGAGTAAALACTDEDAPWETDMMPAVLTDGRMAAGLEDDLFWLKIVNADDEDRETYRLLVLYQLLRAKSMLDDADVTEPLAWAVKAAFSLWTTDLDDDEFPLSIDE
jgi:hypothetical protein